MDFTKTELKSAQNFLSEATKLIKIGSNESSLRHNISSYLPLIFPDMPWWVREHAKCAEMNATFHKQGKTSYGFVDTLVGATAIEYEKNINNSSIFSTGYNQVKDYCADLLNKGIPKDLIIGILSDTVQWRAFQLSEVKPISAVPNSEVFGREHISLHQIDALDLSNASEIDALQLKVFLEKYLGRLGARTLNANSLASDLGFDSKFSIPHMSNIKLLVDSAFSANPEYAELITNLWKDFVSYLGGESVTGEFDRVTYISELYILTLSKLICANILSGRAIGSNDTELISILDGTFFQNHGLSNLVEFDYFGWLNSPPYVQSLLPVARAIQADLIAYDFASFPSEDLFGKLMAQLGIRSQRLLLGQEWTPTWLAEKLVENTLLDIPSDQSPRLVDMCCGSGAIIVEAVKQAKSRLKSQGAIPGSPEALSKLSEAITGFDIDPLAVILARIGWVLAARDWLCTTSPTSIPIYHADSLFAATPLTKIVDDSGALHFELQLDEYKVSLPLFLISPQMQVGFDLLMNNGYAVAMASAKSKESEITPHVIESLVLDVINSADYSINEDEFALLTKFTEELLVVLEKLQRKGRNGIWSFVLRNSYRPGLVTGKFNGLVSNPPWLALSKIAFNPYSEALRKKADSYAIKPPGAAHLHVEMATVFLLSAIERYLVPGASIGCVLPETILSGHQHTPFRAAAYTSAPRSVQLNIDEIWRVETGTFKNEAVVIFGEKSPAINRDIPGFHVGKQHKIATTFKRILRGNRSAWSDNETLGDKDSGFFNPAEFRQGADIMPRTLIFHTLKPKDDHKSWGVLPIAVGSSEHYLKAEAKVHKTFSLDIDGVSDKVVYDVLLSHHLTPFHICHGAKGILPIERNEDKRWHTLSETKIAILGPATTNAISTILDTLKLPTTKDFFNKLDTDRKKLTNQIWGDGWLVLMGAGGSNVCSAFVPASQFGFDKTIIDQTLYWAEVSTKDEALYLTGLLNSEAINTVIREFQPRGQFGERHIHKLPLGATPPFDIENPAHINVVEDTKQLLIDFEAYRLKNQNVIDALLDPNTSRLHIRRKKLKNIITELPSWLQYENSCKAVYCVE